MIQPIDQSYRFIDINYDETELRDFMESTVQSNMPRVYNYCVVKSYNAFNNNINLNHPFWQRIVTRFEHVEMRSSGFYIYDKKEDMLQAHLDKHGDLPGDYYTILIPIDGLGEVKLFEEVNPSEPSENDPPFWKIMDHNELRQIGSIKVSRPVIFRPTEYIHSAEPVIAPRSVFQLRIYNAPSNIDEFAKYFVDTWNA